MKRERKKEFNVSIQSCFAFFLSLLFLSVSSSFVAMNYKHMPNAIYWLYQFSSLAIFYFKASLSLELLVGCHICVLYSMYKRAYARLSGFRSRYQRLVCFFCPIQDFFVPSASWILGFAQCMSKLSGSNRKPAGFLNAFAPFQSSSFALLMPSCLKLCNRNQRLNCCIECSPYRRTDWIDLAIFHFVCTRMRLNWCSKKKNRTDAPIHNVCQSQNHFFCTDAELSKQTSNNFLFRLEIFTSFCCALQKNQQQQRRKWISRFEKMKENRSRGFRGKWLFDECL